MNTLFVVVLLLCGVIVIMLQVEWIGRNRARFAGSNIQKFMKITDEQTLKIHCDHCAGSGLLRAADDAQRMEICPICQGLGMHRARFMEDIDVLCGTCHGMGRILEGERHVRVCSTCNGKGVTAFEGKRYQIHVQKVLCQYCEGRGVITDPAEDSRVIPCEVCFGLGSKLVRQLDPHDKLCASCGGLGRLVDEGTKATRFCDLCDGRGIALQ